ncbi:MAG: class I SAM-dependent methyltransferase, partial [Clostridia bacterium]|nr:class I SAM-dependent methyltransferase [Clostridia bacterium]
DAACGTGLIALEAAKRGISVTGVDNSPAMLAVAAEKARAAMLSLPFVRQPLQAFALHKPVDALTCVCDGINYLLTDNDLEGFFQAAYRALNPGGVLVFDVSTPYKLRETLGSNTFFVDDEGAAYVWEGQFDSAAQTLGIDLTLFIKGSDSLYTKHRECHTQRAWTSVQIITKLEQAGFLLEKEFGDDFISAPTPKSQRHHFVAKRISAV